jgi:hypothetical protein
MATSGQSTSAAAATVPGSPARAGGPKKKVLMRSLADGDELVGAGAAVGREVPKMSLDEQPASAMPSSASTAVPWHRDRNRTQHIIDPVLSLAGLIAAQAWPAQGSVDPQRQSAPKRA